MLVSQRFCFLFSLRYFLLVWGYIKMTSSLVLLVGTFFLFEGILGMVLYHPHFTSTVYIIILVSLIVLLLTDIGLNIIFIVGVHKKCMNLMRSSGTYYGYSIIYWVLSTIISAAASVYLIWIWNENWDDSKFIIHRYSFNRCIALLTFIWAAQLSIQAYVLLVVRRVIKKFGSRNPSAGNTIDSEELELTLMEEV